MRDILRFKVMTYREIVMSREIITQHELAA